MLWPGRNTKKKINKMQNCKTMGEEKIAIGDHPFEKSFYYFWAVKISKNIISYNIKVSFCLYSYIFEKILHKNSKTIHHFVSLSKIIVINNQFIITHNYPLLTNL